MDLPGVEGDSLVVSEGFIEDNINKDMDEMFAVDEAEARMDKLEGCLVSNQEDEVCLLYEEDRDIESKVHDTLSQNVEFWRVWSIRLCN